MEEQKSGRKSSDAIQLEINRHWDNPTLELLIVEDNKFSFCLTFLSCVFIPCKQIYHHCTRIIVNYTNILNKAQIWYTWIDIFLTSCHLIFTQDYSLVQNYFQVFKTLFSNLNSWRNLNIRVPYRLRSWPPQCPGAQQLPMSSSSLLVSFLL